MSETMSLSSEASWTKAVFPETAVVEGETKEKKSTVGRKFWLETDLEPDDVLALWLLVTGLGWVPHTIVVGERWAPMLGARAERLLIDLCKHGLLDDPTETKIIVGTSSQTEFKADGAEYDLKRDGVGKRFVPCSMEQYADALQEYIDTTLADGDVPVFVSLKPMRELILMHSRIKNLGHVELYAYGSFNFRCLKVRGTKDEVAKRDAEIVALLRRFGCASVYESFHATGSRNTMTKKTMPSLFDVLLDNKLLKASSFHAALLAFVGNWNAHMLDDCKTDLKEARDAGVKKIRVAKPGEVDANLLAQFVALETQVGEMAEVGGETSTFADYLKKASNEHVALVDKIMMSDGFAKLDGELHGKFSRNYKPVQSILESPEQMVAADSCLAACMIAGVQPVPVKLWFEGSYTKFEVDKSSTVHLYRDVDWKLLEGAMTKHAAAPTAPPTDAVVVTADSLARGKALIETMLDLMIGETPAWMAARTDQELLDIKAANDKTSLGYLLVDGALRGELAKRAL